MIDNTATTPVLLRPIEHGANIVAYGGTVEDGMAKNWYTAELGDVNMGRAFDSLRRYARDNNLRLSAVAEQIVSRHLDATTVLHHFQAR